MLPRQWGSKGIQGQDGPVCDDCPTKVAVDVQFVTGAGGGVLTVRFPPGWVCTQPSPKPSGPFERIYCPQCAAKRDAGGGS